MKRALAFLLLMLVFLAMTFPHELIVKRLAARRLPASVDLSFRSVRPSLLPLGYRLSDVVVEDDSVRGELTTLRVGLGLLGGIAFDANACGGTIDGHLDSSNRDDGKVDRDLEIRFASVDPSTCLVLDGPNLAGTFNGTVSLSGLGRGSGPAPLARIVRAGTFAIDAVDGSVSGYLPSSRRAKPSGKRAEPQPIGRWEFASLAIEGAIETDRITISRGRAEAEGVAWETVSANLVTAGPSPKVQVELRARRVDDSARSKAILGLLPKAVEREGWRRYRVSGGLSSIQISGVK